LCSGKDGQPVRILVQFFTYNIKKPVMCKTEAFKSREVMDKKLWDSDTASFLY
jgi:hypothetical protein